MPIQTNAVPRPSSHVRVRMLCEAAIFIAIAEILGYIKLFHMPQGGSVSLMMLPILVFAFRWGWKDGLLAGLVLGVVDFMLGGGFAIDWRSILGDYVIACCLLGLAGVFAGKKWGLIPGFILGSLGRYVSILVTGATLWGVYMPDEFMGMTMTNPWFYSMLYNIPILVSGALAVVIGVLLYSIPGLRKYFLGQDILR